ncbi:MAG: hypothetical protein FJ091_09905 [Deltaproteobacteria bacterium]|nr:hypothetical protein [Deltaproteobacteria bacterium]
MTPRCLFPVLAFLLFTSLGAPASSQAPATGESWEVTSWNMACTGPDAMSGRGEITRTPNSYAGAITMDSEYGAMKIQLSGKLLGECTLPK